MKNALNAVRRFLNGLRRPSKATNLRRLGQRGETLQSLNIREAARSDIPALAELHVRTWSDTYGSVVNPPAYQLRERQWREQFDRTDGT